MTPKTWREHFEKLLNSSKPEPIARASESGRSFETKVTPAAQR